MLLRDYKLKELVHHIPSNTYCMIVDRFYLEEIMCIGRTTVWPIYVAEVLDGDYVGKRFATFHQTLIPVGEVN